MKRVARVSVIVGLTACTSLGSDPNSEPLGAEPSPGQQDPAKAAENATPPVGGEGGVDGIFVSSSRGADAGDGTQGHPVKTLSQALVIARAKGKPVIACAEKYDEDITLLDGISAYGSYDCAPAVWRAVEQHAQIVAKHSPAVTAKGITLPTRIKGFDIVAPDLSDRPATDPRASASIGVYVRDSKALTFDDVAIYGGSGAPGVDGVEPDPNAQQSAAIDGQPGAAQMSTCTGKFCYLVASQPGGLGGTSKCAVGADGGPGGRGGDGQWYNPSPVQGPNDFSIAGRPQVMTTVTAAGGAEGLVGARGKPGADGNDGANGQWKFDVDGFVAGAGTAGALGAPGQGGGGGGGGASTFARMDRRARPRGRTGISARPPGREEAREAVAASPGRLARVEARASRCWW